MIISVILLVVSLIAFVLAAAAFAAGQNAERISSPNPEHELNNCTQLIDELSTKQRVLHDIVNTSFVVLNNLQNQVNITQSNVTAVRHQFIHLQDHLITAQRNIEAQMNRTLPDEPRKFHV